MNDDVIRLENNYYILATSSLADDRTRVLKHAESFAVFDRHGDLQPVGLGEQGLYVGGTRFLSRMDLRLEGVRPVLLSSTVKEDNAVLAVDMTNPDISRPGGDFIPRGSVHVFRSKFLWKGRCHERIRLINYGQRPVDLLLSIGFDADFVDIFEVRGVRRDRRGRREPPRVEDGALRFFYHGLDNVTRETHILFSPAPDEASAAESRFFLHLEEKEEKILFITVDCRCGEPPRRAPAYHEALEEAGGALRELEDSCCRIRTSNEQFDAWLNRSLSDLALLLTETEKGPYPCAGIPWFSTVFGRDGIITAFETLWVNPGIARGVLGFLAATQAREADPERDAEPGKILHEMRVGEMAALGEIPFGRYYGSVDATPLFVALTGAYYTTTADAALVKEIWPNIRLALDWMDTDGDTDGDGFVEYRRRSGKGLVQQGWKDSHDSVFHEDGTAAEGPIALCEVQGYAYAARRAGAKLAALMGDAVLSERLAAQAERLRRDFEEAFWCEDLSTYALALDGKKRPCRVRTSNAGHCLFSRIAGPERARRTADTLLSAPMYSGWGVRTLSADERRYNPMSYHNGSVWPHDNALIALGLSHYEVKEKTLPLIASLFDASLFLDLHRMPELFCGFRRRGGEGPTLYPVACAPQAWAAGVVFLSLQACLGLALDAPRNQVRFCRPLLPPFLDEVRISNLRVGGCVLDLILHRHPDDVGIQITRKTGPVDVLAVK